MKRTRRTSKAAIGSVRWKAGAIVIALLASLVTLAGGPALAVGGTIEAFAGTGTSGYSGDGGSALLADLSIRSITADALGNVYVLTDDAKRIRKIAPNGVITHFAGVDNNDYVPSGDGGPATAAGFGGSAYEIAADAAGNVYVSANTRIRKIGTDGIIDTIAGGGDVPTPDNEGLPARQAVFSAGHIAVANDGTVYFDDSGIRIRKISANGTIVSVAGTGEFDAPIGDGGPALQARVLVTDFAVAPNGDVFVIDTNTIRKVSGGTINTIAGGRESYGYEGDGGPASSAIFWSPASIEVDSAGEVYISDGGNVRVRRIVGGTINTFAGTGDWGDGVTGNGGSPTAAPLAGVDQLAIGRGNLYLEQQDRLRVVTSSLSATAPGAPTGVSATGGNGQATVNWTAPGANGGSSILGYIVTAQPSGRSIVATGSPAVFPGLPNGTATTFKVRAFNATGAGAASAASSPVTPVGLPGRPTNVGALPGNASATVSWTAPASNGGGAITGYQVVTFPGGATLDVGNVTTTVVSTLTNGTAYTFAVKAKNSAGTGLPSAASNSVTPGPAPYVPGAPTGAAATPAASSAAITWVAPTSNGGAAITGYRVTAQPGNITKDVGVVTSTSLAGLTDGIAYSVTVQAKNSAGTGPPSNTAVVTPYSGGDIITVAGGANTGDGQPASTVGVKGYSMARDAAGNVYVGEQSQIRRIGVDGKMTTFAGTGKWGYSGDGGPASGAQFGLQVTGMVFDTAGNMYLSDWGNNRIRKITPSGVISTFAGFGYVGNLFGFDCEANTTNSGTATQVVLCHPEELAIDGAGNLLVNDAGFGRIRKITPGGQLTTVAGDPQASGSNEGGSATNAHLGTIVGLAVDSSNRPVIASMTVESGAAIRRISGGTITTIAGSLTQRGMFGDGGNPINARFKDLTGVNIDSSGNTWIADNGARRIRKITGATINTVAGIGQTGTAGDEGPAVNAAVSPIELVVVSDGSYYVLHREELYAEVFTLVRRVDTYGTISTLTARTGTFLGDGLPAAKSALGAPTGMAVGPDGSVYVTADQRVRRIAPNGVITTFAGGRTDSSDPGNGGPATNAYLYGPQDVAVDSTGIVYIADGGKIRKVALDGTISTFAEGEFGTGSVIIPGLQPRGLDIDAAGNLYVTSGNRVHKLTKTGAWTHLAGDPETFERGDGGPATAARLSLVDDLAVAADGTLYLADAWDARVRKVANGIITTFAGGNGEPGDTPIGDSGPATAARLYSPTSVEVAPDGRVFIGDGVFDPIGYDRADERVRVVENGIINTYAGNGSRGFTGDGGPANHATMTAPTGLGFAADGKLYLTDYNNQRLRAVIPGVTVDPVEPGAPATASAIAGNASITVNWTPPASDGGSPITEYNIRVHEVGALNGSTSFTASGSATSIVLTGPTFVNGHSYEVFVLARNAYGDSPEKDAGTVTPTAVTTVPGAPTAVIATPADASAFVSWSAPASDGGSAVTGYQVTRSPGGVTTDLGNVTSTTITGLTNGTSYTFTVKAKNAIGLGPASSPSNAVTPTSATTVPGAPTGVSATAGNASAMVSWTPPANTGGTPITEYQITRHPGAVITTVSGSTLSTNITGLTNGTAYYFTVRAKNSVGVGPASSPSPAVTPTGSTTAPGAPTGVSATAGNASATVSWTAPASNGGSPITEYQITRQPGDVVTTVAGSVLSTSIPGLTNGTAYTFTVRAKNAIGLSAASPPSNAVTPLDTTAEPPKHHAITPARILDTRDGTGLSGSFGPQQSRDLTVVGVGGVPSTGVTSVILNVTVTGPSNATHLTLWPAGVAKPTASNLNVNATDTVANLVVVKVGAGGKVSIFNNSGNVHVIADVVGYFDAGGQQTGGLFTGVTPARLLDTRDGTGLSGTFGPQISRDLTVVGVGGVPGSGVTAVVLNVTATGPSQGSHLRVWPAGVTIPNASNVNFDRGETVPNLVVVKVGTGGKISIYNNSGNVHVIADVVGYFQDGDGSSLTGVTPARLLDTRDGTGLSGAFGPGIARDLRVTGVGGVPASGVTAVVLNVTVTGPSGPSHLTVWPAGIAMPTASNLNFIGGQTVPNLVMVKVGASGKVSIFNNSGSVHVIADVVGYYTE